MDQNSQPSSVITIHSTEDLDTNLAMIRESARKAHEWIAEQTDDPIAFLRSVKFEKKGFHPITHRNLNLIEQVNQTWTYTVALEATRLLLERHPNAGGFTLAPGATASQELDIMSVAKGLVGAETFAATSPGSNQKMKRDLEKLKTKESVYLNRYVFFAAPTHPRQERQMKYEREYSGIEVWSLKI
jgi:hypothetical protein